MNIRQAGLRGGFTPHQLFRGKSSAGFTLIELLVVIAIIGILATLIFISLGAARARARDTRVVSNLEQAMTVCILRQDVYGDHQKCVKTDQGESESPGALSRLDKDTAQIDGVGGANDGGITLDPGPSNSKMCMLVTLNAKSGSNNKKFCRDDGGNVTSSVGSADASCNLGVCNPGT